MTTITYGLSITLLIGCFKIETDLVLVLFLVFILPLLPYDVLYYYCKQLEMIGCRPTVYKQKQLSVKEVSFLG